MLLYSAYYRYCNFVIDMDLIYINTYVYKIHGDRTTMLFLVSIFNFFYSQNVCFMFMFYNLFLYIILYFRN